MRDREATHKKRRLRCRQTNFLHTQWNVKMEVAFLPRQKRPIDCAFLGFFGDIYYIGNLVKKQVNPDKYMD